MAREKSAAQQLCEDHLREVVRSNCEQSILPSENHVAEKLLARSNEMAEVYDEIYPHLYRDDIAWRIFLDRLLSVGSQLDHPGGSRVRSDGTGPRKLSRITPDCIRRP